MAAPRAPPDRPLVPAGAEAAPWWAPLANGTEANFITEDLFLGACVASEDLGAMKKRGITHILICHPDMPEHHPKHFCYARLPIPDEPVANLLELLPQGLAFLCAARARRGKTFVLCAKGISRSASCVTALLMFERGVGFEDALRMVQRRRPIAFPNVGFRAQLQHFEAILQKAGGSDVSWEERLERIRSLVPRGSLQGPEAPFAVEEAISANMHAALDQVHALADKRLQQPGLVEEHGAWGHLGLFFEGTHKYGVLPSDRGLVRRAWVTAAALRRAGAGARFSAALAKELEAWAAWAEPRLGQVAPLADGDYASDGEEQEEQVGAKLAPAQVPVLGGAYDSSSDDEAAPAAQPRGAKRPREDA